jgi:acetyl esterase/lipase
MTTFYTLAVLSAWSFLLGTVSGEPPPKFSVLVVDGVNNHDWPRATRILKEVLEGSGRFKVDVSTSPSAGGSKEVWSEWRPDFAKYNVVLSNFNGGHTPSSPHWPRDVERALEEYVRGGGGLVIYHSANNSFPNWPAYNEMIGLGWRDKNFGPGLVVSPDEKVVEIPKGQGRDPGHGSEHDFQVTVLNPDHPITKGLPKKWMHPHEQLTHGQHGPARNMTVLTYAWSKDTKDNEVMDWVIPFGKGRVYVTMLGHLWKDGPDTAMRCVGFQTMLIRGCESAAIGKVSYAMPKNFPTANAVRLAREAIPREPTFDIQAKKPTDHVNVEIKKDAAAEQSDRPPTKSFTYKKTKQADLEMVVHFPPGWKDSDKRPAIVFFFGGGWTEGSIHQFEPQASYLASRGMVAARADYRVKSRHGVTPNECVEDAKSAVRWLRQNAVKLGVDPNRIVAAGGSAGGHIAACTALTPGLEADGEDTAISSMPNALVLFNPVLRFDGLPPLMAMIGNDEAVGKAISPTLHLKKDSPTTMIFFGTTDRLKAMGDEFMKRSRELGHRAELFTAERQSHGFFNRSPWQERTTYRMDEFLVSLGYLNGQPTIKLPD